MYFYVVLLALLSLGLAGVIDFEDCGGGTILEAYIPEVNEQPYIINHKTWIHIEATIKPNVAAQAVTAQVIAVINGQNLTLPGLEVDVCHSEITPSCPMKSGNIYGFKTKLFIAKFIPPVPMNVTYLLRNEDLETIACARIPFTIRASSQSKYYF